MNEEKRFEATPSRLARAKREGNVARSQDLGAVASFAAAALALFGLLGILTAASRAGFLSAFHQVAAAATLHVGGSTGLAASRLHDASTASGAGFAAGAETGLWPYVMLGGGAAVVPLAGLGASLLATYLQTRTFVFRLPPPSLAKLDPFKGFARLAGRDAAIAACKAALVSAAVGAALVPALRSSIAPALGAAPGGYASLALRAVASALGSAIVVAGLFACGDAILERLKWKRRLRMSFDELRRDHKATEGDPLLRGRRRQRHRALIRGAVARVRDAAFVVTNPTHVAIALEYAPPEVSVPRVLVRALDEGAREVKRLAREHDVPIVENVSLARALLATTDVGEFIPPDTYGAIAAIVAMLLRTGRIAA